MRSVPPIVSGQPSGVQLLESEVLLTRPETARVLRVSEDCVSNLHRVRSLVGVKVGRSLRWTVAAVRRYATSLGSENET